MRLEDPSEVPPEESHRSDSHGYQEQQLPEVADTPKDLQDHSFDSSNYLRVLPTFGHELHLLVPIQLRVWHVFQSGLFPMAI